MFEFPALIEEPTPVPATITPVNPVNVIPPIETVPFCLCRFKIPVLLSNVPPVT